MVKTGDDLCKPLMSKNSRLLKFHYVHATSADAAVNSTNEANKAGRMCH